MKNSQPSSVPLSTILLDAGGVLLDETEHEAAWRQAVCDVLGMAPDAYDAEVREAVRTYCPRVYRFVIWRHTGPDGERFERRWADVRARYRERRPALRVMAGIGGELRALTGRLRIGVAGQYGVELLDALREAGLLDLFDWQLTQDDFDITKPDPRYLVRIAEACGVDPRSCIMVGDRIDKDVVPAKQVGMATILVRGGLHRDQQPRLPEEVPDAEIDGVRGLAAVALRLSGD